MLVYRKGVFCLENEWFGLRSSVSVRPALELLRASDYHVPYIHRDVATRAELEHYIRKWFQERNSGFEVLWLSMHSRRGMLLPGDMRRPDERIHIDRLEEIVRTATGVNLVSVHHDISTITGEEVLVFSLAEAPTCRARKRPPP